VKLGTSGAKRDEGTDPLKMLIDRYSRRLPEGVIFDFDGTLMDSEETHWSLYREAAERLGFSLSRQEYMLRFRGRTDQEVLDAFLQGGSAERGKVQEMAEAKQIRFREMLWRREIPPMPGAVEFLKNLYTWRIPFALATSAVFMEAELGLMGLDVMHLFEGIISAESVARGKPDPEVYYRAADLLRRVPGSCLVFEDSPAGVRAAVGAGCEVIGVSREDGELLLEAGALLVIPDFQACSLVNA